MAADCQREAWSTLSMRPSTDKGHKRDNSLRCRNLGLQSFRKRSEVTKWFERKILLLDLWPQTTEKFVGPPGKVWIATKQYLHVHNRSRQPSLQKDSMKVQPYLRVCPGAQ